MSEKLMSERLFERFKHMNVAIGERPYAINLGAWDGKTYHDPVYPLYAAGFSGVAIEGQDPPSLSENLGSFDVVLMPSTFIYSHNIADLLHAAKCPLKPEFLKIDIDGCDADILRAILEAGFRPLAIQAEVNMEIPPPIAFSIASSERFIPSAAEGFFGFSLQYGCDLLSVYGYALVELDTETPFTHDGLWIHRSLLEPLSLRELQPRDAFLSVPPFLPHIATASPQEKESWRHRVDYEALRSEIWSAILRAGQRKHGHADAPFELYISRAAEHGTYNNPVYIEPSRKSLKLQISENTFSSAQAVDVTSSPIVKLGKLINRVLSWLRRA